jgi:hypothetical protein
MEGVKELIEFIRSTYDRRIESLEADVKILHAQQGENAVMLGKIETKVDGLKSDMAHVLKSIAEIVQRPGKRWDTLVVAAITALVGVAVGIFIK